MERKYATGLRNIAITAATGLALLVGVAGTSGCNSISRDLNRTERLDRQLDKQNKLEHEIYEFANKLSRKMPKDFVESKSYRGLIYHDKSLEVSKGDELYLEGWPKSGDGRFVEVSPDRNLRVCYWDYNEIKLFTEGKIKAADMKKIKGFGYSKNNNEEKIEITGSQT